MANMERYQDRNDALYERAVRIGFSTDRKGVFVVDNYGEENTFNIHNINPSRYIIVDDERYFVKYPTLRAPGMSYEVLTETFISFLARKLGFDCVDQHILVDHKLKAIGVASHDFGEHITLGNLGLDRSVTNVQTIINTLRKKSDRFNDVEIDYDAIAEELNKRACFDYLVKQTDRHGDNIAFRIITGEDGKRRLELAPIFDNGNAFVIPSVHYGFQTNDDRIYARGQQALLDGKYRDMLNFFDENFSEENFPKLMQEFDAEYGLSELLGEEEYNDLLGKIKNAVQDRLYYCHKREQVGKIISPEATYLMVRNHEQEYSLKWADNALRIYQLTDYYSADNNSKTSFDSFATGRGGEFAKFDYFEEAEEIDRNLDPKQRARISAEIEKRKRNFEFLILDAIAKGKIISSNTYDLYTKYVLLDANEGLIKENTRPLKKEDEACRTDLEIYAIIRNHHLFVDLREWYDQQVARSDLSLAEKIKIKRAQKILNGYIRRVNATTNKNLSQRHINMLREVELENGIKEEL